MIRKIHIFLFVSTFVYIKASDGDRSPFYQKCLKSCFNSNCTNDGSFVRHAAKLQDLGSRLLLWECPSECQYQCMWRTVDAFEERGYTTPKFHGKWPFKKLFGIQEPASAFASLLNLAAHFFMYSEIKRQFTIRNMPLVMFWHLFALVCMNAWIWSTIFHTRDTPFTEFMDYTCALSMVISLFVAAVIRVFHKRRKLTAFILTFPFIYFILHVQYLASGRIDYDYNMMVNIFFGVIGSVIWLLWAVWQYIAGRKYTWRVAAFTLLSGAALALEVLDFPPKHEWDAHALWHLSTAPLPLLFYRFVIDDLNYMKYEVLPIKKSNTKLN